MPTKAKEMQYMLRQYRKETGNESIDMHDLARFAVSKGWPLPTPKSAIDRLAEQFSRAAREEVRKDDVTGRPYRANIAVTTWQGSQQITLWHDIDTAPRKIAHKALIQRREQMVGDALQLTFDAMHWNRINPSEEPIVMPLDLEYDVQWRMNASDDEAAAA
jgi:hypothetical protein